MNADAIDTGNPKDLIGSKKPPISLCPSGLLVPLSKVVQLGAKKYGKTNWRSTKVRYTVYVDAAFRHLLQALDGEDLDSESGQPHLAHVAACVAIVLDADAVGTLIDDRPLKGAASKLIAGATEK